MYVVGEANSADALGTKKFSDTELWHKRGVKLLTAKKVIRWSFLSDKMIQKIEIDIYIRDKKCIIYSFFSIY